MKKAARVAHQIVQSYKSVRGAERYIRAHVDDLLLPRTHVYQLFDAHQLHSYDPLFVSAQHMLDAAESLIKGIRDWRVGNSTIADELDAIMSQVLANDQSLDEDLYALRQMPHTPLREVDVAGKLVFLIQAARAAVLASESSLTKGHLLLNKGNDGSVPFTEPVSNVDAVSHCQRALQAVQTLAQSLLECGNGVSTVRDELEKSQRIRVWTGQVSDPLIDRLLKAEH